MFALFVCNNLLLCLPASLHTAARTWYMPKPTLHRPWFKLFKYLLTNHRLGSSVCSFVQICFAEFDVSWGKSCAQVSRCLVSPLVYCTSCRRGLTTSMLRKVASLQLDCNSMPLALATLPVNIFLLAWTVGASIHVSILDIVYTMNDDGASTNFYRLLYLSSAQIHGCTLLCCIICADWHLPHSMLPTPTMHVCFLATCLYIAHNALKLTVPPIGTYTPNQISICNSQFIEPPFIHALCFTRLEIRGCLCKRLCDATWTGWRTVHRRINPFVFGPVLSQRPYNCSIFTCMYLS